MGKRHAVIDIGSNAVGLAIFTGAPPDQKRLVAKKVKCGLARELNETGRLTAVLLADLAPDLANDLADDLANHPAARKSGTVSAGIIACLPNESRPETMASSTRGLCNGCLIDRKQLAREAA